MSVLMFHRLYHSSSVLCTLKKQGLKLNKMLNPKKKQQWYPSPVTDINAMPSVKQLTKTKYEPGKQGARRIAMLNKLFMKYVTDIMSTGTVSMNIVGQGIEISKVKISPDFKTLNVFWICKGSAVDRDIEVLLNKTAGVLRHELSTLRLMGEIPYIEFVKDQQESMLVDLDNRLSLADYGEDYTPTELGHLLKSEFTMNMKLSPEMKAKIKQLEDELPMVEDPIPEMTHTVYGLDHAKIMSRLLAARKKSRDAWTNLEKEHNDDYVISYRTSSVKNVEQIDTTKQKRELADFLHKRQILQNKLARQERKSRKDLQVQNVQIIEEPVDNQYEEEEDLFDFDESYYDDRPKFNDIENINKLQKN